MRRRQGFLAAVLLLLGMYFLDNLLSGHIYFYINMNFGWLTWLGTGILLLLGTISVLDLVREAREGDAVHVEHDSCEADAQGERGDHEEHDGHEHSHSHALSWPKLAIVAVPLVVGALVPAKPLVAA